MGFIKIKFFFVVFITFSSVNLCGEKFVPHYNFINKEPFSYQAPTQRQIAYESLENIQWVLEYSGTSSRYLPFWTEIIANEESGFFGYQAAKQGYRVFQDIIKIIFEEILEFEIKKDFHFLRIPLDPSLREFSSSKNFLEIFPSIDDGIPQQRDQIISMNYTLFGNFSDFSQCTVCYFAQNHSWFTIDYGKKLVFLFKELGLPINVIPELLQIGSEIERFQTGVIFQFFDESQHTANSHAYDLVNLMCYPALGAGHYDSKVPLPLSQIYQETFPKKFDSGTGQLRLLMNTSLSLNPYGDLTIRRYDLLDAKKVEKYEGRLRQKIASLARDYLLVENYKNKLKVAWYVE